MTAPLALLLSVFSALPAAARPAENPVELGRVAWGRDHDAAFAAARERETPVLILFQEVPGCAACKDFGRGPLSHPLLVEAIETEFVPLFVANNVPGADAQVLRRYEEKPWGEPALRLFGPDGRELLPRSTVLGGEHGLAERLVAALEAAGRAVPRYLRLVVEETSRAPLERAVFAVPCFWEGEAELGRLEGVQETRVGWLDGREVVEVLYDPARLGFGELLRRASRVGCANVVFVADEERLAVAREAGVRADATDPVIAPAKASDAKFHLAQSRLRWLPLTPLQATRVNAALDAHESPAELLSPRQRELLRRIDAALANDPAALEGLAPPAALDALADYAARLRERLGRAGA